MESFLKFVFVADQAVVDETSNKLNAFGIFNFIKKPEGEPIRSNFVVAGELYAPSATPNDRGVLSVRIISPSGAEHAAVDLNGGFDEGGKVVFSASFSLVEFSEPGEYSIDLLLNGTRVTRDSRIGFFAVNNHG